ncbi:MAG: S8 family peptidase [Saprospiraceae bacterium]|nr:S8 family peptidase [Saprospiraceae bacterium]MCF8250597.1 S8 family peptidase [Saprospiraceae bacterium]MCF8281413.1 S8 family peptidase [Bacteroidales bacterium]MCF8313084.1 S8 family peptidase [Saprospiraceae bacterium]MCF8441552.1 S8 family peptidase [Saprospiraceae bacterium]
MKIKSLMLAIAFVLPFVGMAQLSAPPENWQHLDKMKDGYFGVSANKMYSDVLSGKKSETVVVAVIDGGVDWEHEDLKDVMWTNPGEIPGNNIDDDNNGYVDDVHGWNFIGGKNGNVNQDQLEITRVVAAYQKRFKNVDASKLSGKEKKEYDRYKELEETVASTQAEAAASLSLYRGILESIVALEKQIGKSEVTFEDIENFKSDDPKLSRAAQVMKGMLAEGATSQEIKDQIQGGVDYFSSQAEFQYDVDFDARSVVGDNYANSYERYYGNNDVKGPDASHGTHVSGIIAASRGNGVGMDGIANNVKIMAIRCVPDGDERDKDVANSIIYAVDNGATVINMSFGKGYSWDKEVVDKAVKYAMKHDVLLVHAAGNSHQDNDNTDNFPNDKFEKRGLFAPKKAKNWIEVGALSWKNGEDMAATFSNYGKENVDLFAPGVDIYSTTPEGNYARFNGTSMASPVVAGVAAAIRSYYPNLSAVQVKDLLMSTTTMNANAKVKVPGDDENIVPFTDLCVTGGAVNGFEAAKKAEKVKGKRKKKFRNRAADAASGKSVAKPRA